MTTVGIVSPGAMGSAVGQVLAAGGARVVATLEHRSARTAKLAEGIELLPSLDAVVEAVGDRPLDRAAGRGARGRRRRGGRGEADGRKPDRRRSERDRALDDGGCRRAPRGRRAGRGRRLDLRPAAAAPQGRRSSTSSGARAAEIASLPAPGLELRVVGDRIGMASAIKMSTASFYKGQTALLAQALRAARANGVLEFVLDDLRRNYPELVDDAPRMLQSIAAKSGRYVAEMREIAATQEQAGLTPDLFAALATVFLQLSETEAARLAPEQVDRERDAGGRARIDRRRDRPTASAAAGARAVGAARRRSR